MEKETKHGGKKATLVGADSPDDRQALSAKSKKSIVAKDNPDDVGHK